LQAADAAGIAKGGAVITSEGTGARLLPLKRSPGTLRKWASAATALAGLTGASGIILADIRTFHSTPLSANSKFWPMGFSMASQINTKR